MSKINLKDYYPHYIHDSFIDLPDEIITVIKPYRAEEQAHRRRMYRNKVYSLDMDGIENHVLFTALSPCKLYERKLTNQELYSAIASLPDKQAKRIYARFFLGMSIAAIAKSENVRESAVRDAIARGLRNMEKYLKNIS